MKSSIPLSLTFGLALAGSLFADNTVVYTTVSNTASTATTNVVSFNATGPTASTANRLLGTSIGITTLSSPSPLASLTCFSCTLTFSTGTLSSYSPGPLDPFGWPTNPSAVFNSGGFAVITGGVDLNGNNIFDAGDIGFGDPTNTQLLTGSFMSSVTMTRRVPASLDGRVLAGLILNSQNTTLNNYLFGNPLGGPRWTGSLSLSFTPFGNPLTTGTTIQNFVSDKIVQGSLTNVTVVPEPGSILTFSAITGVLGIGLLLRRRRTAQQ